MCVCFFVAVGCFVSWQTAVYLLSFIYETVKESKVAHWFAVSVIYETAAMGYVADSIKYGVL